MAVRRTAVNPWPWSVAMSYNQAEVVEGASRVLVASGQAAMSPDGQPQHEGDMAAQLALCLDNIEAVLAGAGMTFSDVVHITTYTTDIDAFFAAYGALVDRLSSAGVTPPHTLVGVTRLAFPGLLVEIEMTAAA
jgi:enamine deaminase RidA (YjgF/YER057c/UK114 family)